MVCKGNIYSLLRLVKRCEVHVGMKVTGREDGRLKWEALWLNITGGSLFGERGYFSYEGAFWGV